MKESKINRYLNLTNLFLAGFLMMLASASILAMMFFSFINIIAAVFSMFILLTTELFIGSQFVAKALVDLFREFKK